MKNFLEFSFVLFLYVVRLESSAMLDQLDQAVLAVRREVEERNKRLAEKEAQLEMEADRLEGDTERQAMQVSQLQKEGVAREAAARIADLKIELVESVSVMTDEAAAPETQSAVKIAELEIELDALKKQLVETQQTEVAVVSLGDSVAVADSVRQREAQ